MKSRVFIRWVFCNLIAFTLFMPTLFLCNNIKVFPINSISLSPWYELIQIANGLALPVVLWSVLLGFLQWVAISCRMILLPHWLLATIASWLSLMIIVLFSAFKPFNFLALSPLMEGGFIGLIIGTVVGIGQTLVIRKHLRVSGRWILANAASYSVGIAIAAIILSTIPYGEGPGEGILLGFAYWILPVLVGVSVGIGTGIVLSGALREAELRVEDTG